MKLDILKNKNDTLYYLAQTVRVNGKTKTIRLEKLGKHSELIKVHDDPVSFLRDYVKTKNEELDKNSLTIKKHTTYDFNAPLSNESSVSVSKSLNIGYFFLNAIYKQLNLDTFFKLILKDSKITYDPSLVTKFLSFSRILSPKSKLGTYDDLNTFYEKPDIKLQDIYKTLDILSDNLDLYQSHLYKESLNVVERDTSVLYYDCTNYFFEIETEDEFRKYGLGKDHKPNPIVNMGLFMDRNGIPLAFSVNPGNVSEQTTTLPLERKLIKDFKLSKFIYVSDAGLGSNDTRLYNTFNNRDFIVTQSLKKLKEKDRDLILTDENWQNMRTKVLVHKKDIKDDDKDVYFKVMEINNPIDIGLVEKNDKNQDKKKTDFKQTLIVTYQKKYALYQQDLREKQLKRAYEMMEKGTVDKVNQTSPRRLIKTDGDVTFDIDLDKLKDEIKYDGYYAVVTSISDMEASEILKISAGRWEIEESFRILKTNFKSRPVYHKKDSRIIAHFTICFTALLIYRLLEKKLDSTYTIDEIINQLRVMNVLPINEAIFESTYTGSKLLDDLASVFNLGLDKQTYSNTFLNKMKR